MDESKSKILDACSKEFGEDIVFGTSKLFEMTNENVYKLFHILDNLCFDSKLSTIKDLNVYVGNRMQLNPIISMYVKGQKYDIGKLLALYQPDLIPYCNTRNEIVSFKKLKEGIFINTCENIKSTCSYMIQTLLHEMIHSYDTNFGTLLSYTIWALNHGALPKIIDYNSHFTKIFKQKKAEIKMDSNIDIRIRGDNLNFDELNLSAADQIQILKENDSILGLSVYSFPKEMKSKYKNFMFCGDDGSVSFSFGAYAR